MSPAVAIHAPDCSMWDAPAESQPDALMSIGLRDERVAVYLSSLRPVYDAIKRCLGQISGLLLLLQTCGLDSHRGDLVLRSTREQLAEAGERMRSLPVPEAARRHFDALALQLRLLGLSESMGHHDSEIMDDGRID
jgi:hypothetical protein